VEQGLVAFVGEKVAVDLRSKLKKKKKKMLKLKGKERMGNQMET